jgi:uncharacterized SAM-binding protein YcdF (DUF218 family)
LSWPRLCRGLGVLVIAGLLAAVCTPLSGAWCERALLERRLEPADAVVVLGSGVNPKGEPSASSQRKALLGIELYRRRLAPVLVFVGAMASEAEGRRRAALDDGVPPDAILTMSGALTTKDEAESVAASLRDRRVRHILLVTGAIHMRRAAELFARAGFEVAPAPVDDTFCWEAAAEDRVALAYELLREQLALAYYRLAGYL